MFLVKTSGGNKSFTNWMIAYFMGFPNWDESGHCWIGGDNLWLKVKTLLACCWSSFQDETQNTNHRIAPQTQNTQTPLRTAVQWSPIPPFTWWSHPSISANRWYLKNELTSKFCKKGHHRSRQNVSSVFFRKLPKPGRLITSWKF